MHTHKFFQQIQLFWLVGQLVAWKNKINELVNKGLDASAKKRITFSLNYNQFFIFIKKTIFYIHFSFGRTISYIHEGLILNEERKWKKKNIKHTLQLEFHRIEPRLSICPPPSMIMPSTEWKPIHASLLLGATLFPSSFWIIKLWVMQLL